jgi:TonB-linked SusC/RagA family outer membrane protein
MRKILLTAALVAPVLLQQAAAQNRQISGRVTDRSNGQGLPGVTVLVKGTTIGVSTNADGSYTISAPTSATALTFSSIGFVAVERAIGDASTIDIGLAADSKQLGEVVVTGLGEARQAREVGYATAKIEPQELTQARVSNVTNGLAGKVSGLQIQTLSNGVNPQVRVTLRGTRSLTGENQALIVLDGVLVPSDVLTALNPDDVADVTILKGANAAAIYGSQASNGALVITTKKGSTAPVVTFSHTSQFERLSFLPKLQNSFGNGANEYGNLYESFKPDGSPDADYEYQYQGFENQQYGPRFNGQQVPLGYPLANGEQQYGTYSALKNERRKFFNTGYQMQNNVSFSGGNDRSKVFVSFQNVRNNGIVPNDVFDRNTFRLNASQDIGKLKVGFNASYSQKKVDATSNLDQNNSVYWTLINTAANIPITNYKDWRNNQFATPDGWYNEYYQNPYFTIDNNRTRDRQDYLVGDVNLGYKLTDWASVQYRLGATISSQSNLTYQDKFVYDLESQSRLSRTTIQGFAQDLTSSLTRINSDFLVNLNKSFGDITVSGVLGNNVQHGVSRYDYVRANALLAPGTYNVTSNRVGELVGDANQYGYRQYSFFGDATVGFREYLFVHGSVRNDVTSLLRKENRSIWYPSVDVSFVFTDVIPGLKDNTVLDYGKLRAGVARVGQFNLGSGVASVNGVQTLAQTFGAYSLDPFFSQSSGFPFGGISSLTISNREVARDLKPEFTTSYEVGGELAFLKRRVNITGTYYTQKSTNQTISAGIAPSSGFGTYLLNAGEVRNKGFETDLNVTPVQSDNGFTWRIGANYNYNNNEVISIAPGVNELALTTGGNAQVYAIVGQPYPVLRGTQYARDTQGRVIMDAAEDPNGSTIYFPRKSADLTTFGNTLPKHKYGFNTSVSFKGLTLAAQAEMRTGYYVYHSIGENLDFTGASERSASTGRESFVYPNSSIATRNADGTETYSPNTAGLTPGGSEFWANASYNTTVAENFVTKGNFFKIREVSLSYTVPTALLGDAKFVKGVTLNVFARNLYTWLPKENQWTDPEFSFGSSSSNGVGINTINQTPPTRFFGANLSATF